MGMRLTVIAATALLLAGCGQSAGAGGGGGGRDYVWAAGSSTVFPFTTRVAENYARKTGARPPRVEALGTGGGLKAFCSGVGPNTPDVANASRRIKDSELADCRANGVRDVVEIQIGYDGLVVANRKADPVYAFTVEQLYRGLAKELPTADGRFAPNPNRTWRDVDPSLPDVRIQVYGPPPTSGTRDSFVELGMRKGAEALPAMVALKARDEAEFERRAGTIREDGAWIDTGENDNAVVQTLNKTPGSLGVFGYAFLRQNRDSVRAATIDGVVPTPETISAGEYPIARSMFLYVKRAHVGVVPGLRDFVREYVSDASMGRGGYLQDRGLIPLTAERLEVEQRKGRELVPMAAPTE
jgi:phosphate transport system substrate-binding protein